MTKPVPHHSKSIIQVEYDESMMVPHLFVLKSL